MSAKERIHPIIDRDSDDFTVHLDRYRLALPYVQDKKVLDIGCGMGYGAYYLRSLGARAVTAVDKDGEAIRFAKNHYILPDLLYLEADFIKLETKTYDVLTVFEFIEHVADPRSYLNQATRCLSNDGLLILSTPNINNPDIKKLDRENPYHLSTKSKMELEKILREVGFKDIRVIYQRKLLADPGNEELREQLVHLRSYLFWYRFKNLIRKIIGGDEDNRDWSKPRVNLYRWAFSIFPSETAEIVIFICSKSNIQSIHAGDLHLA